jgi:hypothetical protein
MKLHFLLPKVGTARFLAIALMALCGIVDAQTVRPLINELGNPAKGRVEYVNDASVPLNVTVEAKSFSVSEKGEISYRPLDGNIHLKLSATSFRVPPQQSYFLFYEATSDKAPAWFVIYAAFSGFGFKTQEGMNVRVQLPHTVYLLPKERVEKPDVHIVSAVYDAANNSVKVITENTGANFGRVQQAFVSGGKKRQEGAGFPVFPQSRRQMEYPWQGDQPPDKVSLEFEKFKVESEVTRSP